MKRKDLDKYQQATNEELLKKITELEHQVVDMNLKKAMGTQKNLKQPMFARRDISRLKTIIRQRELVIINS